GKPKCFAQWSNKAVAEVNPINIEIKPRRGWGSLGLAELWQFRELLYFLIWREVKGRYRQMALGPLWIILKPFVTMVVFSIIFGRLAKLPSDGIPYPLFAYSGLLPWQLFAVATGKSAASLVTNMGVISKVYFPRLVVPLATACSGLVDFCMSFLILVGMMLFYGVYPGWNLVFLPAFLVLATAAALAVGLCLATLAVKFRDVSFGVEHALQVVMYLTPVVYASSLIPETWRTIYRLNPMTVVIEGFRWSLLGQGQPPDIISAASAGLVLVLLFIGAHLFRRTERNIVDLM
ncbi:MAG: ABC transporter permease, partial [Desulfarculaceae bacterium]